MDLATRYTVPDHVVPRQLGEETVILDLRENSYFGLNEVGSHVWQGIAQGLTGQEICDSVLSDFEAEAETVRRDVVELLDQLLQASLIDIDNG